MHLNPAVLHIEIREPESKHEMPEDGGDQSIKPAHDFKPLFQSRFNILIRKSAFQEPGENQPGVVGPGGIFRNPDGPVEIG